MNKIIYQDKLLYPKIMWQRPVHKYNATAGKVMILAGSKNKSGAAILTCEAVFRSGTGIILLGFPESLKNIYKDVLPEAMNLELPETPGHTLAKKANELILENAASCDVLLIGPGLSENAETTQLIWELVFKVKQPIIACADAVKAIIKGITVMRSRENKDFMLNYLTNRPNEMTIIINTNEAEKFAVALKINNSLDKHDFGPRTAEFTSLLAQKLACNVVLTGINTVIATNTGNTIITRLEDSKHATGETNDVLAGVIASFLAGNPDKHPEALATAVYLFTSAEGNLRNLPKAIKKAEE